MAFICDAMNFFALLIHAGTNGKQKKDEESSDSEEEETDVQTPKNTKKPTTPQTFPKANKKVRAVKF